MSGQSKLIQTQLGPRSNLSLPPPLPLFQPLLLDLLPGGHPQLPDRPHDGAGGVRRSPRGERAAQPMSQCCHVSVGMMENYIIITFSL